MYGFDMLLGHLVGDYIVQNDWMAKNKVNPNPGTNSDKWCQENDKDHIAYWEAHDKWLVGHIACTFHCALYTLSMYAFTFNWITWWGLLLCFIVHWPIDRFRLARKWMENVSGQKDFANGVFSPWSIIIVDNIFHLLTIKIISILCL